MDGGTELSQPIQPGGTREEVSCSTDPLREKRSGLVGKAVAGDSDALAILLERARPEVLRWAVRWTKDLDDAEYIAQMVLLRMHAGLSSFRGKSRLSSWLYRITLNEVSVFLQKEERSGWRMEDGLLEAATAIPTPPEPERIDRARACEFVKTVACTLPPLQLAVFQLVDLQGWKPCEAAEELGKTQANIRSSLCRARNKIRELVRKARRELAEEFFPISQ